MADDLEALRTGAMHQRAVVPPARLWASVLLFGVPAAVFTVAIHGIGPMLLRAGYSWFTIFHVVLVFPLTLLLVGTFVAVAVEGQRTSWPVFQNRLRLHPMPPKTWLWSVALAGFMYGGSWGDAVAFGTSGIALMVERQRNPVLWVGVLAAVAVRHLVSATEPALVRVRLYEQPAFVTELWRHFGPTDFMGISLSGAWWLIIYYGLFLLVVNIGGEELWWRGYVLPRQEAAYGKRAWLVHGSLWAVFHIFFQPTLWDIVRILPTCLALAFVCQRERNTWPGIVGHTFGNAPLVLQLGRGVAS